MKLSILDLAHVPVGSDVAQALRNTLDLARHVDGLGYTRYWLAEHHNMPGIASAATAVVIGQVAAVTQRLRVGAGGIMLPNHAPLVIAEQFGTLEALYPGRIDLGLGRAPGTDGLTWRALRRDPRAAEHFPDDVQELQALLGPVQPDQQIVAVPGAGTEVPLWILGSSLFGAQVAAALGLPFGFASHFAPDALREALHVYRTGFQPSRQLAAPHAMVGCNVFAADTDAQAQRLFTSLQQQFTHLYRGHPLQVQPPRDDMDAFWLSSEKAAVDRTLQYAVVGGPDTVREKLAAFIAMTGADELMLTASIYDHHARLRSFEIAMDARRHL